MEGHNGLCSKGFRSCLFSNGTRLSTQPGEDFVHCTQDSHWIANQFDSGSSGIRRVSEYGYSLKIGEKSNVYSYGVVVLEVLTGKQPIDPTIQDGLHIVDWVKKMRDIQVIDKGLLARPECDVQEMMQTLGVALLCVNTMPEDRPTMRDVAAMLSEIRQEREESTKGVENNGCSGSCNNNGGERIDDSSPSSVVQQTAKYLRNSSKSFSASSLMYSSFYYY
uniref:Serine-threonine/tyrosine-protein kinase catalytic domain-containing protein n=1 Tax=Brassica campestris TaxID=3711 RepID=A0A3P5YKJ9_BRACM|nr:unnamed protein product [Brassica rapa]